MQIQPCGHRMDFLRCLISALSPPLNGRQSGKLLIFGSGNREMHPLICLQGTTVFLSPPPPRSTFLLLKSVTGNKGSNYFRIAACPPPRLCPRPLFSPPPLLTSVQYLFMYVNSGGQNLDTFTAQRISFSLCVPPPCNCSQNCSAVLNDEIH